MRLATQEPTETLTNGGEQMTQRLSNWASIFTPSEQYYVRMLVYILKKKRDLLMTNGLKSF